MKLSFFIFTLLVKQLCKVVPEILHGPYKTKLKCQVVRCWKAQREKKTPTGGV